MSIQQRTSAEWNVLAISGDLDISSAPRVASRIQSLPHGSRVVFDLRELTFIGAAGLGLIAQAVRRFGQDGVLVVSACPKLGQLLEITAMDEVVRVSGHMPSAHAAPRDDQFDMIDLRAHVGSPS